MKGAIKRRRPHLRSVSHSRKRIHLDAAVLLLGVCLIALVGLICWLVYLHFARGFTF
ncbi:MAG: hypothetical protein IKS90_04270 [Clostridia bacterium]|nr:hypothetical protein [Clostridia bacterium]